MKIEPTLLSQCADAGVKAALSAMPGQDTLLTLRPTIGSERRAREAFAQAVIESYFPTLDTSFKPLADYLNTHPDVPGGELLTDAALRLIKERDVMRTRLAQLEWRPVSVMPMREDAGRDGDVSVLMINDSVGVCNYSTINPAQSTHWRPVAPPVPAPLPFDLWWSTATEDQRRDAACAGWNSGSAE